MAIPGLGDHRRDRIAALRARRLEVQNRMRAEKPGTPVYKALGALHTVLGKFEGWMKLSYKPPLELTPNLEVAQEQAREESQHQAEVADAEAKLAAADRAAATVADRRVTDSAE